MHSPLTLRLALNLLKTDVKALEEYSTLIKLAFYLVDRLASFKLSSTVKTKLYCFLCIFVYLLIINLYNKFRHTAKQKKNVRALKRSNKRKRKKNAKKYSKNVIFPKNY